MTDTARPCWWCGLPNVAAGSGPALILELLEDDGGWWTAEALSTRLELGIQGVRRALFRYAAVLERRVVAGARNTFEWRWKGLDE